MIAINKKWKTWLPLICLIVISAQASTPNHMSKQDIQAFFPLLNDLQNRFPKHYAESTSKPLIVISTGEQRLFLIKDKQLVNTYIISTATAGTGNNSGSNQTPLGVHQITQKIGKGAKAGTIFKARSNTQRIAKILSKPEERSTADNVTTRILWLSGLEKGINKGGNVDSHARYIYIHGTDEEGRLGTPASHGCIRMNNQAVIELFDQVSEGTLVDIVK